MLFTRFGGREDDAQAAYLHEVASSSIYVGILGRLYGRQMPSRHSATHAEYLAAEHGLRVAVWAKDVEDREGYEESFLEEVRTFHATGRFSTPAEFAEDVDRRFRRIAAEDLAPWAKLGAVVFRARRIAEGAGRGEVVARVRREVSQDLPTTDHRILDSSASSQPPQRSWTTPPLSRRLSAVQKNRSGKPAIDRARHASRQVRPASACGRGAFDR